MHYAKLGTIPHHHSGRKNWAAGAIWLGGAGRAQASWGRLTAGPAQRGGGGQRSTDIAQRPAGQQPGVYVGPLGELWRGPARGLERKAPQKDECHPPPSPSPQLMGCRRNGVRVSFNSRSGLHL